MASRAVTITSLRCSALILTAISIRQAVAEFCQGYLDQRTNSYTEGFNCPRLFDEYEEYKCCGPSDRKYCCDYEEHSNYFGVFYWSPGKIAGVVIGAFFGLVLTIVVVIVICYLSCANIRRKQRRDQIAQTVSRLQGQTPNDSQRLHAMPQQARMHQGPAQAAPPAGNPQPLGRRQQYQPNLTEAVTYAPQSRSEPTPPDYPGPGRGYPDHTFAYDSPPPTYYAQETPGVHTYAPEVAPPPPPGDM